MEFWGVEVASGKPLTCKPGADSYVHISMAALGDARPSKGNDRVVLKVKVGSNQVVVGTLSQGKCDQTALDLIFEKDFVLSHNSSGSVFFCGYKTDAVKDVSESSDEEDDEFDVSEEDVEEDAPGLVQQAVKENGKLKAGKSEALMNNAIGKSASKVEFPADAKPKAKPMVPEEMAKGDNKKSDEEEEDDDDEDEDDEDEDEDEDNDMLGSESDEQDLDSDDEGDSDDEESEEEQPKALGKKRALASGTSGLPGKKSKIAVPGKLDSKLPSVPVSTPKQQQSAKKDVPAKKTPARENAATLASGKKLGQYFCEPCKKNFNSESALNQHKTAKHK